MNKAVIATYRIAGLAIFSILLFGCGGGTQLGIIAALSSLSVSGATLDPAFNSSVTIYSATVPNGSDSVVVSVTTFDSNASFTINGTNNATVALAVGNNTISIVVTAENGTTTKNYTIVVTRDAAPPPPPPPTVVAGGEPRALAIRDLDGDGIAAANFPTQVMTFDFTGFPFPDFCTGDTVFVQSGDIRVIFRQDIGGDRDGFHLVNHAVGSFDGTGLSGDQYRINVVAPSLQSDNWISNASPPQSTAGVTNIIFNVELINVTSPGSGVSRLHGVLVFIVNGIGEFDSKMVEVSETCVG